jgi:hypothetical protein
MGNNLPPKKLLPSLLREQNFIKKEVKPGYAELSDG